MPLLMLAVGEKLNRHHPATARHSARVGHRILQILPDCPATFMMACLSHDIGKATIPLSILDKPARLSSEEWALVAAHPAKGVCVARHAAESLHLRLDPQTVDAILHHHERWDGGGYPHGLAGERIPYIARLIAIIDSYDAMTAHDRPYATPRAHKDALREIEHCAGSQFDPTLVELALANLWHQER